MPLLFSGFEVPELDKISMKGADSDTGAVVPVHASHEVIQDYGREFVQSVASDKYDSGNIEEGGIVIVRAIDCKGAA